MLGMESLDHKTAAVIIPPESVWGPIQAIRQNHDSKVGRWMPHITLVYTIILYCYSPTNSFEEAKIAC